MARSSSPGTPTSSTAEPRYTAGVVWFALVIGFVGGLCVAYISMAAMLSLGL
jgi:hypothetical protein